MERSKSVFRALSNISDRVFCENNSLLLAVYYFFEKGPSEMFDRVVNRPL